MWRQKELKAHARLVLKRTFWLALGICLLTELLTAVSGSVVMMERMSIRFQIQFPISIILTVAFFSVLYNVFITNPIRVGFNHFFMASRQYDISIGRLFSVFSNKFYWNTIKILFERDIYIFLWGLLFIIPGIIKSYEYFFVPYILAENPKISSERVFEISKAMTDEDKIHIFSMEIYFLLLEFLGMFAFLIGTYLVLPYKHATFAELYAVKRAEALQYGRVREEELCGFYGDEI